MLLPMTKPRIIFISGVGRSGSTLLDRVLGQTPGVVSVGEVYRFWSHRYLRRSWCSCGALVAECPFWDAVEGELGATDAAEAETQEARQWRVVSQRNLPLLPMRPLRTKGFAEDLAGFLAVRERLYRAILKAGDGTVVVDSTKIPRFALALARSDRFDLRIVHLVRDSRASAYSWVRPKSAPTPDDPDARMQARRAAQVSAWWMVSNPLTELLRLQGKPYLRVRYEDYVRDLEPWTAKVLDFAGIDARPVGLSGSEVTFTGDHLIAGNPIRKRMGTTQIRPDDEWKTKMGRRDRLVATAMTWPLLLRYRYRI